MLIKNNKRNALTKWDGKRNVKGVRKKTHPWKNKPKIIENIVQNQKSIGIGRRHYINTKAKKIHTRHILNH